MAKQNEFLVYFVHNEDGHWQTKYFKDGFKHCGVNSERTGFPSFMGSWIKEHSCVSYVQRLIGLNKWWIFSPYQLYCALKKRGYSEIDL